MRRKRIGARLTLIASAAALLLLIAAAALTHASAWIGLRDDGEVRISGAIAEVEEIVPLEEVTPVALVGVEAPGLQLGSAGYDCDGGAFRVAVQAAEDGPDVSLTLELWRAGDGSDAAPVERLAGSDHTLAAGSAERLRVEMDDPPAGTYRLKVVAAPGEDGGEGATYWSAVVTVDADACAPAEDEVAPPVEEEDEPVDDAAPPAEEDDASGEDEDDDTGDEDASGEDEDDDSGEDGDDTDEDADDSGEDEDDASGEDADDTGEDADDAGEDGDDAGEDGGGSGDENDDSGAEDASGEDGEDTGGDVPSGGETDE